MTAAGLEERNVDDAAYAFVQTRIREIDDAAEALDLLTDAMNSDQITPTQSTTLFNLWEKLNKEDPPVKEDFVDTTTGVPAVRDNFLRTITTDALDEIYGSDTVLVQQATFQFEDMYVDLTTTKKAELGRDLTNYEKRLIAREVVQNLKEIFVSLEAEEGAADRLQEIAIERSDVPDF